MEHIALICIEFQFNFARHATVGWVGILRMPGALKRYDAWMYVCDFWTGGEYFNVTTLADYVYIHVYKLERGKLIWTVFFWQNGGMIWYAKYGEKGPSDFVFAIFFTICNLRRYDYWVIFHSINPVIWAVQRERESESCHWYPFIISFVSLLFPFTFPYKIQFF